MITARGNVHQVQENEAEAPVQTRYETWTHWPVNWTSIWVGTLTAFALVLIFGLIGIGVGAHVLGAENRIVELKKWGIGALAFSVAAAFLAFTAGGWVAGKIAGIYRSEPAMLHGAIVWLLAAPLLALAATLGAGNYMGSWHGALAGSPAGAVASTPYLRPDPP